MAPAPARRRSSRKKFRKGGGIISYSIKIVFCLAICLILAGKIGSSSFNLLSEPIRKVTTEGGADPDPAPVAGTCQAVSDCYLEFAVPDPEPNYNFNKISPVTGTVKPLRSNTPNTGTGTGILYLILSCVALLINMEPSHTFAFTQELTISSINCNSLNSSIGSDFNRNLKVNGITKLGSDVIMLSDTRLSNKHLISCAEELRKLFATNLHCAYDFHFNSTRNKRGVGILLKKTVPFSVQDQLADTEENFLLLKVLLRGEVIILGSVYGPNNTNPEFFNNLKQGVRLLSNNGTIPVLLGGDWNCTPSVDPVELNIDTYNMRSLPNHAHSVLLNSMCTDLDLIEPFRLLHYNKIDFSYAPRSEALRNKSRIDFFLISGVISRAVSKCYISDALQNKLFDHKAVNIYLNSKKKSKKKGLFITNKVLNSDLLDAVVYSTVADTYLHHIVPVPGYNKNLSLEMVGTIKQLITTLGIDFKLRPGYCPTEEELDQREAALQRIRYLVSVLNIQWLEGLDRMVDTDIFMEVLINNVRNEVTSYQSFLFKEKKKEFDGAVSTLNRLKSDYVANDGKIRELEKKLNDLSDAEMRQDLECFALFEHVSAEKMSPKFLELAKLEKIEAKLDEIKDADGSDFASSNERKSYITRYFADIYKKSNEVNPYEGCINDFLGPDILQHPTVRNAKMPDNLKTDFERPLSSLELDNAVSSLCSSSAGGPDGLSVKFVKKYWSVFRHPLTEYASFCINKGGLSQSFATASIKLIPKKGDTGNIKNWRPISLLNVLYKVMSKALNNRLKKVSGKLITRSQKGFVDKRYIQECLINIIETINYGNQNNIQSFCLALDQKKAFDSVSHQFMTEVYKFFGFGPNFINMINVLTTGRTACIIWDDGTFSENIPLEGGHTQGNGPSPLLFDFCQQILLFKLEFSPEILSVMPHRIPALMAAPGEDDAGPAQALEEGDNPNGQGRVAIKDDKVETFADDATLLARATRAAAGAAKRILTLFFLISGLQCNFDKSTIMFFGYDDNNIPDWADEIGFKVVSKTRILGCDIESDLTRLTDNFEVTINRIRNLKLFWSRFNLSLPGRIGVAKSLMLAQINYLGCFLLPTVRQVEAMQGLISDFIKGRANIGKDRIFFDTAFGGLGMIDVRSYILSQQCSWIKRLCNGNRDTYKDILLSVGYDNPGTVKPGICAQLNLPVLGNIDHAFGCFYEQFLRENCNWKKSSVLYNPLLKNERGLCTISDQFVMHNRPVMTCNDIATLTIGDIWAEGRLRSLDDINETLPIQLSLVSYMRLGEQSRFWEKKTINSTTNVNQSKTVSDFLNGVKKGSKHFRAILNAKVKPKMEKHAAKVLNNFLTCCGLADVRLAEKSKHFLDWWCHHFMPNRMRDFLFKFISNTLSVNARLANYMEHADAGCTFCKMEGPLPVARETFVHLFHECPSTAKLHSKVIEQYCPELILNNDAEKKALWLLGLLTPANRQFNLFLQILIGTVNFYVWECKIKKCKLSWYSCDTFCKEKVGDMMKISSKLEHSKRVLINSFFRGARDE
jgi:exonuclease III